MENVAGIIVDNASCDYETSKIRFEMMEKRKFMIGIASDHAGYELKEYLKKNMSKEMEFIDFGTKSAESVDYPDFAHQLALRVSNGELMKGILICGTGNGMSMTANKYPDVRAALCWNVDIARLARQHNDANIVVLPARFIEKEYALEIVDTFFSTSFEGGRHQRRIDKININHSI